MTNKSEADSKEIYDNFKEVAKKHKERIVSVEFNLTVGIGQQFSELMKAKKFNTETVKDHEILMLVPREMGMVKIWYDGDLTDFKTLNRWVKNVKNGELKPKLRSKKISQEEI